MTDQRWICFDVGEVLVDESRIDAAWADHLGLPVGTYVAVLGGAIARGGDHRQAFDLLGVDDWESHDAVVQRAYGGFRTEDLYPDVAPTLVALRARGYRLAVIGNQPANRRAELAALGVDPDVMAMSDELGAQKPSAEFFARSLELMGGPEPSSVAYVGDRVDNDLRPAREAGMRPVWLRRGPWGYLFPDTDGIAVLSVDDLDELVARIDEVWVG